MELFIVINVLLYILRGPIYLSAVRPALNSLSVPYLDVVDPWMHPLLAKVSPYEGSVSHTHISSPALPKASPTPSSVHVADPSSLALSSATPPPGPVNRTPSPVPSLGVRRWLPGTTPTRTAPGWYKSVHPSFEHKLRLTHSPRTKVTMCRYTEPSGKIWTTIARTCTFTSVWPTPTTPPRLLEQKPDWNWETMTFPMVGPIMWGIILLITVYGFEARKAATRYYQKKVQETDTRLSETSNDLTSAKAEAKSWESKFWRQAWTTCLWEMKHDLAQRLFDDWQRKCDIAQRLCNDWQKKCDIAHRLSNDWQKRRNLAQRRLDEWQAEAEKLSDTSRLGWREAIETRAELTRVKAELEKQTTQVAALQAALQKQTAQVAALNAEKQRPKIPEPARAQQLPASSQPPATTQGPRNSVGWQAEAEKLQKFARQAVEKIKQREAEIEALKADKEQLKVTETANAAKLSPSSEPIAATPEPAVSHPAITPQKTKNSQEPKDAKEPENGKQPEANEQFEHAKQPEKDEQSEVTQRQENIETPPATSESSLIEQGHDLEGITSPAPFPEDEASSDDDRSAKAPDGEGDGKADPDGKKKKKKRRRQRKNNKDKEKEVEGAEGEKEPQEVEDGGCEKFKVPTTKNGVRVSGPKRRAAQAKFLAEHPGAAGNGVETGPPSKPETSDIIRGKEEEAEIPTTKNELNQSHWANRNGEETRTSSEVGTSDTVSEEGKEDKAKDSATKNELELSRWAN
ncbi:MAG: hypothetical protein M1827_000453 [Pycnora praestabilis]|nr:MAG: hypothetical protein M1827_000453 [Pycnora praestabilis]